MFLQRPKKASMTFYLRPRYYSFVRKQGTTAELRLKTHLSLLYVKYSVILCPRNNMHVSLRVLTVAWSWRIRHDNATRDKHWTGISPNRDQCQRRTLILISAIGHSSIDSTSGKAETDSALWTAVATFHIQVTTAVSDSKREKIVAGTLVLTSWHLWQIRTGRKVSDNQV